MVWCRDIFCLKTNNPPIHWTIHGTITPDQTPVLIENLPPMVVRLGWLCPGSDGSDGRVFSKQEIFEVFRPKGSRWMVCLDLFSAALRLGRVVQPFSSWIVASLQITNSTEWWKSWPLDDRKVTAWLSITWMLLFSERFFQHKTPGEFWFRLGMQEFQLLTGFFSHYSSPATASSQFFAAGPFASTCEFDFWRLWESISQTADTLRELL